ncbi:MAG: tRNA pseudouridine(38-40) synthase TruA [Chlamydiales bacterium]|nr:tRNA pseudouridine(38-40) synthase TruA [Chlamydiales bacterium]
MHNYKLVIAYDGTNYSGWQIQPNGVSIQELIQKALSICTREDIKLIGSGRTDAGVHAQGQVAHFLSSQELLPNKILYSLNGMLPSDIRIKQMESIPNSFHAQYSTIGKIYHYNLWLDPVLDPTKRLYTHHVKGKFHLEDLIQAASLFLGTWDFTSFANEPHTGSAAKDPIRTLKRLDIVPQEGGVRLEFEGDGFLYKMVRNITGTLLEIATAKRNLKEVPHIFAAKDRKQAGLAAPAKGLFLMHVLYP